MPGGLCTSRALQTSQAIQVKWKRLFISHTIMSPIDLILVDTLPSFTRQVGNSVDLSNYYQRTNRTGYQACVQCVSSSRTRRAWMNRKQCSPLGRWQDKNCKFKKSIWNGQECWGHDHRRESFLLVWYAATWASRGARLRPMIALNLSNESTFVVASSSIDPRLCINWTERLYAW